MLLRSNPLRPLQTLIQISTSAEILPLPCNNNDLDPVIAIQDIESAHHVVFHHGCESIVLRCAGDGEDYDGCYDWGGAGVVGECDLCC